MPFTVDEPICPKFQPNIFDPLRCHDCLRQRHLHSGSGETPEVAPLQKPSIDICEKMGFVGTGAGIVRDKGVALATISSQAQEKDTSSREDSDCVSVVSSYCDVSGGRPGYGESSLCILSPDCALYICDGDDDDSTDSCRDHSDYQEFSGSVSGEEEYLPVRRRHSSKLGMTRLDPPPHRPNPRAWMDEARSRDGFTGRTGMKDDREKRESGYFSLGRAAGSRSLHDNNPPAPFRHYEKGHPIFSNRNVEPKDTVPFRNPNLGVASERLIPEPLDEEVPVEIPPPDPYEIAVEVEAQVGPRTPSPTPFKIAESLAATGRKGFSASPHRGNSSSQVTSLQKLGRLDSSKPGSAFQSRSSSPARGNLPFRRSESSTSLNKTNFGGGGARSHGAELGSRSSLQSTQTRHFESGTLPRNFKSLAGSAKSQSSTVSDFRSALRKRDVNGSSSFQGQDSRSSSPSRRDYSSPRPMTVRKTESGTSQLARGRGSRTSSPSGRAAERRSESPSPPRRTYSSSSQSPRFRSESLTTRHTHYGRCGSPVREGYDFESQALMRNSRLRNTQDDEETEPESVALSPPRRGREAQSQSILRKTESNPVVSSRGRDSRSSSPGRRGFETSNQYQLRKTDTTSSTKTRGRESRNASPSRRSHEAPSQSLLRSKAEGGRAVKSRDDQSFSPPRKSFEVSDQRSAWKTQTNNSLHSRTHNSRNSSPSRKDHSDPPGYSILRTATNGESGRFMQRNTVHNDAKSDSKHPPSSWRGSTTSLRSSSLSRAASPARQPLNGSRTTFVTSEKPRSSSSIRSGFGRHDPEDRGHSPNDRRPGHRARSPSPSPQIHMQRHTSSLSSVESSESGRVSVGSTGRNREEYAMMADLPKVKRIHVTEEPRNVGQTQNQKPPRRQELFKPASHSLSRHPSRETLDAEEKEWHYSGSGYLSRAHSSTSLQRSGSPTADEGSSWKGGDRGPEQMQPDLLNFKKGWMSKLDNSGEWKKHWFVLTDAGLKYYRDSNAEEKDDMDGEIDLKSCVKVSEFDVEKNYGFQIQTREAVFTLSAMTAGIRRNWIEVLKKCIRPSSSPDLTQLPDSGSDKENSHTRYLLSSRPSSLSRHNDVHSESPASVPPTQRRFDYVELSPVPKSSAPLPANQREAGEGQGREHTQWQEERTTSSQWEAVLSRKGTGSGSNQMPRVENEIEKKWAEFERMPLKEMSAALPMGSRPASQSANEALQREVASLRQQLEGLQRGMRGAGGGCGGGEGGTRNGCGPDATCGRSLAAMERAQQRALEELQRQHERHVKELELEKERLLREETQDTARVMEALRKKHKEELEREVEKVKRLSSGVLDSQTLQAQQQAESQSLQRELAGLSERYSQKCLELNRAEQSGAEREREISRKERDMEQLRRENQGLKARLSEEISRLQCSIKAQGSKDKKDRTLCELEVLLRVKENEIEYLHKEISCLRNEIQFLNTEKQLACERYREVQEELSGMKGRSEREIQSLKEHLRLAMAALQEGQQLSNSLDH